MSEATEVTDTLPARAKHLMEIPGVRQGLLLVGVAAAIAIGIATVLWTRTADYSVLYAELTDYDAGAIVNALRAADIKYKLDKTSGAIMVPSEQVHATRLDLAAEGMPQGSGHGFEQMGEEKGFGVSQYMEKARYQYMLETELARTISSLRPVRGARVHLAIPKQSVFVRDRRPASASVMVEMFAGRLLETQQVAAIVHLVASSTPDLEAGNITVVDQTGRLLTDTGASSELALTARQFEYKTRVENAYMRRIEEILMPLVGAGGVRAQVNADLDFTISEQTLETYDPATAALRSEQSSNQTRMTDAEAAAGIPGALSNQPPATDQTPGSNDTRASSTSATRNYELDRSVSHVRQPVGTISRLSVAVIVDERQSTASDGTVSSAPLEAQELERMTTLVREAVGFDAQRGDTVNIVNAPFMAPETITAEAQAWWEQPLVRHAARQLVGLVLVLGVIFGLLRPTVKQLLTLPQQSLTALPAGLTDESGQAKLAPQLSYKERLEAARALVGEDPRRAARVVKNWVAEDG